MHTPRHAGRSGRRICRDKIEAAVTCPAYCQTPLLCKLCALLAIRHEPTSCRVATPRVGLGSAPSGIPIYFRWGMHTPRRMHGCRFLLSAPAFGKGKCLSVRRHFLRRSRFRGMLRWNATVRVWNCRIVWFVHGKLFICTHIVYIIIYLKYVLLLILAHCNWASYKFNCKSRFINLYVNQTRDNVMWKWFERLRKKLKSSFWDVYETCSVHITCHHCI